MTSSQLLIGSFSERAQGRLPPTLVGGAGALSSARGPPLKGPSFLGRTNQRATSPAKPASRVGAAGRPTTSGRRLFHATPLRGAMWYGPRGLLFPPSAGCSPRVGGAFGAAREKQVIGRSP